MASRERLRRSQQACQPCRQLKARCIPSDDPDRCQRCRDFAKSCVWPESRTVHRRPRPRASGISRLEHKLDGLVSHMSAALPTPDSSTSRGTSSHTAQTPVSRELDHSSVPTSAPSTLDDLANIHYDFSRPPPPPSSPDPESTPDVFHGLVSDEQLDELLDEYRPMSSAFPFVPLRSSIKAHTLRQSKPMLLLAIAAAASSKKRPLQARLDQRYREELASHTIITPRKSTGLVQGLLVYLAWYHHFFSHKTLNIFPLLQLLVGLAIDVGLHQRKNHKAVAERSPERQRERDRAFLGCYFLSSTISTALRKPVLGLFKSPFMADECLARLREDAEFQSDVTIETQIRWIELDDRVNMLCQALRNHNPIPPDCDVLSVNVDMQRWHEDLSNTIHNNVVRVSEFMYHFANVELCNAALQHGTNLNDPSRPASPSDYDNIKLTQCSNACKAFLEALLDHSVHVWPLIPFVVWMRLPVILVTLCSLTLGHGNAPSIRLELYLESLCNRMQILTTCSPPHQSLPDFWKSMFVILDRAHTWYLGRSKSTVSINEPMSSCPVNHTGSAAEVTMEAYPDESAHAEPSTQFEDFLTLDWWGGSEGYDPTILDFDDSLF